MKLVRSITITLLTIAPHLLGADRPTENQGANAIDAKIHDESKGLLCLVKFTKTNGQKSIVNGIEMYSMECTAEVAAVQNSAMTGFEINGGWNGSFATLEAKTKAGVLDTFNPLGAGYGANKQLVQGQRLNFKLNLKFDLTEKGWRSEDRLPTDTPFVPRDSLVLTQLGMEKARKGDLDGAIADFNRAIELDPKVHDGYLFRGRYKSQKGDLEGAIADQSRAIDLNPQDDQPYRARADAEFQARKFVEALQDYKRCCEARPGKGFIWQDHPQLVMWVIRSRSASVEEANKELRAYIERRGNPVPDDLWSKVAGYLGGCFRK